MLTHLGGVGVFILAALDSSVLPTLGAVDALTIVLAARHPELWSYYAMCSTAGSVYGASVAYRLSRLGVLHRSIAGAAFDRVTAFLHRFGSLSLSLAAILPPPFPTSAFVILAKLCLKRRAKLEFQASSPAGSADKDESPPLQPPRRWDSSGRCSPYTCAPGKWETINPGTKHSDKKLAIKSCITRQSGARTYLPIQIHKLHESYGSRLRQTYWTFSDRDRISSAILGVKSANVQAQSRKRPRMPSS